MSLHQHFRYFSCGHVLCGDLSVPTRPECSRSEAPLESVYRGHALRPLLAFLSFDFVLRLDDDLNGPLSASLSMLGVCGDLAAVLADLLLC